MTKPFNLVKKFAGVGNGRSCAGSGYGDGCSFGCNILLHIKFRSRSQHMGGVSAQPNHNAIFLYIGIFQDDCSQIIRRSPQLAESDLYAAIGCELKLAVLNTLAGAAIAVCLANSMDIGICKVNAQTFQVKGNGFITGI